jgi:NADP-dependent 3-hydroxy acid dehydrogenase YdfG
MMDTLKNQLAVVTGASSGIGKAIALTLAEHGAEVCLVARRREALEAVAEQVRASSGRSHVCRADLTSDDDIREVAQKVSSDFGRVDVLVLCGGAIFHGPLERAPLAEFDSMYRANVRGHYALIQSFLPLLRKQKGQVVFINSSAGLRSPGTVGQFSATQHAFRAIADSLREEVNADGIRVLSVYPGRTATPRMAALFEKEGKPYRPELLMQPEDIASMVAHTLCLPRTAEVTDISIRPMMKSY